jgi:hypothetical protein
MEEFLPKDVRDGLVAAQNAARGRRSRMRVDIGGHQFTILRYWDTGFSLDPAEAPAMRGLVDIYDGAQHLRRCLVVASAEDNGELVCEFKYNRPVTGTAPVDFERSETAPVGYLTRQT